MLYEFIPVHDQDEKQGKQRIRPAPKQQVGHQYKLKNIHHGNNRDLDHRIPPRFDPAQNPDSHENLCNADQHGQWRGVIRSNNSGDDLLVPRDEVQHFTEQAIGYPNGCYSIAEQCMDFFIGHGKGCGFEPSDESCTAKKRQI
jgi:hypothetical protein